MRSIKSLPCRFILRLVWYCKECLENTDFGFSQSSCAEQEELVVSVTVEQPELMTKGFKGVSFFRRYFV